jgi:hypothetical protein
MAFRKAELVKVEQNIFVIFVLHGDAFLKLTWGKKVFVVFVLLFFIFSFRNHLTLDVDFGFCLILELNLCSHFSGKDDGVCLYGGVLNQRSG